MNTSKQTTPNLQEILDKLKDVLQDMELYLKARSKPNDHQDTTDSQ